ncbi:MAG: hypothetical protein KC933_19005, partial [Myxococcales bacterium]|nr:hypothetical protein [Myxococcales bacterium]
MADPNKIVSAGPNKVFKNRPTPEALGKKTGAAVFDMFKRGLGDAGMEALGAFAKPFAQGLTEHFTKIAQDKGIISAKDTQAVLARLRDLHSIDQFIAAPPAEVTHGNGLLDGRTYSIKETGENGKYKAEGSITRSDHAVSMVFDRLGLDMKGFGQDVADVLDFAGNAKKNLADKDSWITIVGRMAMAAFGAPGSAQSKLGAALNAGINSAAEIAAAPATDKLETKAQTAHVLGAGKSSGAGLAHTAPKTANTGSMSGAMAVRAALLSGLKDQDDAVERTAGKVLGQVMSHLGVLPDKATKKELHATLKKLMADKGSATGKTDPLRLLARTTEALAAQDPNSAVLTEMVALFQQVLEGPNAKPTPALQEAFGSLAASALTDLVAMKLGKEPPETDKLSNEVLGSLRILLDEMQGSGATQAASKVTAEPTTEKVEQPPVDISVWNCDRADLPEQLKSAALQFLTQNGIAADHPKSLPLTNALAEVLQSAVNPATGDVHPADFALQMQRWLTENAGASPKRFEGVQAMLSSTIQAHGKLAEIYQSTQQRYAQLQSQQAASTDRGNSTSLEKELEQLQGELARMGAALERGASKLERDIATLQQDAFQRMKEFIVDGKWAGDGAAAQTAAAGGGGGQRDRHPAHCGPWSS